MVLRNKFISITLLAIVIGLTVNALLKPEFLPAQQIEKLTTLDVSAIHTITINKPNQTVNLSKHDEDWFVLVNNININTDRNLLSHVLKLSQQNVLSIVKDSDKDLVKYGLTKSNFTISFNDSIIKFGNNEPFTNRRYGLSNDKVYIIDDIHYRKLLSPTTDFISKSVIQSGQTVTNFRILWQQKPPIPLPSMKNENLYQNWQQVKAENIERYEGQQAIAIALIQTNFRNILEFVVIPSKNTLKLARKDLGIIYVIPKQFMASLLTYIPTLHN